jgi:hypothetical protein
MHPAPDVLIVVDSFSRRERIPQLTDAARGTRRCWWPARRR